MKQRLQELDALRGIAAVLVVLFHYTMDRDDVGVRFTYGVTGVDLFFIISGFVIFLSISRTSSWKEFVLNRLIRLYPTYWLCASVTASLILLSSLLKGKAIDGLFLKYIVNLSMFQYYFLVKDLDGPYWTLIIEMLFYIGILFLWLVKQKNRIEIIGYAFLAFVLVHDLFLEQFNLSLYHFLKHKLPIMKHFPMFLAGILFYKIKFEKETAARYLGVAFCLAAAAVLADDLKSSLILQRSEYTIIISFYFCIWLLYIKNKLNFIVSKATLFLGRISYSLYLIHQFISISLIIPLLTNQMEINFWIAALVALAVSIGSASLITILFEEPIIRMLKRSIKECRAHDAREIYATKN
ncbi:acyltransferase family protein [Pontibacter sp. 13R65]|uniref:acyltransferase family protein n=1 Tax=Pontibacter sp. 13R65 TaxID=3127458 RepID=UPI00301CCD98